MEIARVFRTGSDRNDPDLGSEHQSCSVLPLRSVKAREMCRVEAGKNQRVRLSLKCARTFFPATTPNSRALADRSGRTEQLWCMNTAILRTRAFHLRTNWSDQTDRTSGKRTKGSKKPFICKIYDSRSLTHTTPIWVWLTVTIYLTQALEPNCWSETNQANHWLFFFQTE